MWQDYVDYSTLEAKCWGSQKGVTRMHVSEGRVHLVHMYVRGGGGVCVYVCTLTLTLPRSHHRGSLEVKILQ